MRWLTKGRRPEAAVLLAACALALGAASWGDRPAVLVQTGPGLAPDAWRVCAVCPGGTEPRVRWRRFSGETMAEAEEDAARGRCEPEWAAKAGRAFDRAVRRAERAVLP